MVLIRFADKLIVADPATYFVTTISSAITKLAPIIAFAGIAYFVGIKLPFLLLLKNLKNSKKTFEPEVQDTTFSEWQKSVESENVKDFQRRMKILGHQEEPKEKPKSEEEVKTKTQNQSQQKAKAKPKKPEIKSHHVSPESLFDFKPGESFSKSQLKKRYHDLLRQYHPDKVSPEDKKAAEQKTKDINAAYAKLKSKAA